MKLVLLGVALFFFLLGYAAGRDRKSASEAQRCPRCRHRRLFWCRGCGLHFDDDDQPLTPREYDRLTATDAFFDDEPVR